MTVSAAVLVCGVDQRVLDWNVVVSPTCLGAFTYAFALDQRGLGAVLAAQPRRLAAASSTELGTTTLLPRKAGFCASRQSPRALFCGLASVK